MNIYIQLKCILTKTYRSIVNILVINMKCGALKITVNMNQPKFNQDKKLNVFHYATTWTFTFPFLFIH